MVGRNKLFAIKNEFIDDFIYLGDSKKDLILWQHCKKAILVGDNKNIKKTLEKNDVEIIEIVRNEKSIIMMLLKQLRFHQWSKNILLFLPVLGNHQIFELDIMKNTFIGFISFSLLASSIYVLNDIADLDYDRKHPKKKNRPIASGDLSILNACIILIICLFVGGLLAMSLGPTFLFVTAIYIILNLLYSFYFKKVMILDIILIMSFYTLRLIAGHIPDAIPFSPWLLSFSIFLFFSLGLLKRYTDIIIMRENGIKSLSGRDYRVSDGNIMMSLGVSSGLISSLVLILYTGSEQVLQFYSTPMILVALAPVMLYWNSRMWLMAERGLIKVDPVVFVIKDFNSYAIAICFFVIMLLSKYIVI